MTGGGVWQDHSTGGRQIIRVRMWPPGNGVGRRRRVLGQMQSSSMQQFMLVYEEVRRLETGRTPAGGQDWVVRRGGSRRHTRQLTAWIPTGGGGTCRYLPQVDPSRTQQTKGPLPAGLPALFRGSGQGQFARALEGLEGCKWVPTCLGRLYCVLAMPVSSRRARPAQFPFVTTAMDESPLC